MEVNYPGQGNDMDFMNTVEDVRRNPLVARAGANYRLYLSKRVGAIPVRNEFDEADG